MTDFREKTQPLYRADQVESISEEAGRLRNTLNAPPHIGNQVQDRAAMVQQLRGLDRLLETQTPRAYSVDERDAAAARERELREAFVADGMPTQEEMRRNPPGAVDKHLGWERRNKKPVLEWKNIRRRLDATEAGNGRVPAGLDTANIERYRPHGLSQSMSMDGAQIAGKEFHFGPGPIAGTVVFSDVELAVLRQYNPKVAEQIGTYTNEQRQTVKDMLVSFVEGGGAGKAPGRKASDASPRGTSQKKAKRDLTPEQRQAIGERLKAGKAKKAEAQPAATPAAAAE